MKKTNGLFLQGGGAKGAFQAGALQVFAEKNITINKIAGTSIGAINGMILFYQGIHRFKEIWYKIVSGKYGQDKEAPVMETLEAVTRVGEHLGNVRNADIQNFYVNYLEVEKCILRHIAADIAKQSDETIYRLVSASSRLPNREFLKKLHPELENPKEIFALEVANGRYDGYLLDGGLVNNQFLESFLQDEVDTLYAIVFDHDFDFSDEIKAKYKPEQRILIKPEFVFEENDTMRFTPEYMEKWYLAGYETAKKII